MKAKLPLNIRIFDCDMCGITPYRDVHASCDIEREAVRLHDHQQQEQQVVAGLRPETRNADLRSHKTTPAEAGVAVTA